MDDCVASDLEDSVPEPKRRRLISAGKQPPAAKVWLVAKDYPLPARVTAFLDLLTSDLPPVVSVSKGEGEGEGEGDVTMGEEMLVRMGKRGHQKRGEKRRGEERREEDKGGWETKGEHRGESAGHSFVL